MRRFGMFLAGLFFALGLYRSGECADSVTVETKSVLPGQAGVTVGVYFRNDQTLGALTLPLEFRSTSGGAFIANSMSAVESGRFINGQTYLYKRATPGANNCSGPTSNSYPSQANALDFVSPDAIRFEKAWVGGPPCLSIGTDGSPGVGTPSLYLQFDVNCEEGTFEIDTCCFTPYHYTYYNCTGYSISPLPVFKKGVITIDPLLQACSCNDVIGDTDCDGDVDIVDVVRTQDVAFRGHDPWPPCCYGAAGMSSVSPFTPR